MSILLHWMDENAICNLKPREDSMRVGVCIMFKENKELILLLVYKQESIAQDSSKSKFIFSGRGVGGGGGS